ncbi:MAG: hypothetical protein IBX48_09645 [Thiomicrospira sp.]|uniref:hypothetical protein n=1 Tax=Thiomicrospira sp. TaxID=935 RepID=UPI001A0A09F9|nr:hypothetical protein [Thiomicrospira sp.]MBE0494589.1 hypothetical protein [Thiomicrospira sp.]
MKILRLILTLFIGLYSHQAWSINACTPLAEAAGKAYQFAEKHVAIRINQTPPPGLVVKQVERVGVWHVYQTDTDLFSQVCAALPLDPNNAVQNAANAQPPGLVYPVLQNRFNQRFAVLNGQFLIKANDNNKLQQWQKDFNLKRILSLYDGETAVFQAADQQDLAELLNQLQRQTGLISVTPLLSEQRYRTR